MCVCVCQCVDMGGCERVDVSLCVSVCYYICGIFLRVQQHRPPVGCDIRGHSPVPEVVNPPGSGRGLQPEWGPHWGSAVGGTAPDFQDRGQGAAGGVESS